MWRMHFTSSFFRFACPTVKAAKLGENISRHVHHLYRVCTWWGFGIVRVSSNAVLLLKATPIKMFISPVALIYICNMKELLLSSEPTFFTNPAHPLSSVQFLVTFSSWFWFGLTDLTKLQQALVSEKALIYPLSTIWQHQTADCYN